MVMLAIGRSVTRLRNRDSMKRRRVRRTVIDLVIIVGEVCSSEKKAAAAEDDDDNSTDEWHFSFEAMKELLPEKKDITVVDVGCGVSYPELPPHIVRIII